MTIIVSGAAGFIGNHLSRLLVNAGKEVVGVDNLYSGSIENINDLLICPNFNFFNLDITTPEFVVKLSKIANVTEIYHLACPESPKYYQKDPIKTITTCINGTINILNFAKT